MCDKLVFDLSQEIEGSPNVFVRKDWINILDNQNQNYNNNQSVIDTSQLSNSNKYMSYREAYFSIPFTVTVASSSVACPFGANTPAPPVPGPGNPGPFTPIQSATSADYCVGLKNWFGQIIHSFTLDYNGTTIIQQTPFVNMWNSFKLMTSLSLDDVNTQGATIGFYPDDPLTWSFNTSASNTYATVPASPSGNGTCNNTDYDTVTSVAGSLNSFKKDGGNLGFLRRQQLINFDCLGVCGQGMTGTSTYGQQLISSSLATVGNSQLNLLWKSYITSKRDQVVTPAVMGTSSIVQTTAGYIQYSIVATVYLKHIHSFFNMCPLLKGVFMKMTMNLNNTSTTFQTVCTSPHAAAAQIYTPTSMTATSISNPLGGVNPLMIASGLSSNIVAGTNTFTQSASNGGISLFPYPGQLASAAGNTTDSVITQTFIANISVGSVCLDSAVNTLTGPITGSLSKSVYLYIPAYIFNPTFESAYLSSPVKQIKYTDIYQYQVLQVTPGGMINNLLTNGIANVKSVLVLPFFNSSSQNVNGQTGPNHGFITGVPVWQSPFDPAGTGATSPMGWLTNFNIQVSGQNAIYNLEKYNFEQFNNQLYGQNAVNGGLTDGITSGLIDRQHFDMEYCYYYVNIERMLPVEQSVPKSIQFIGQNMSARYMDYICFIEYGCEIAIDALTGARV